MGEGASDGTCLRRGSPAGHWAASTGVGSTGRPAGLRWLQTSPAAALGLLRNQAELCVSLWLGGGGVGTLVPQSVDCPSPEVPLCGLPVSSPCSLWNAPG